jgi:hypothetical protein
LGRAVRIGDALTFLLLWDKTACRHDKRCADPADTRFDIGVLEDPLFIKSLKSETQRERSGDDQQTKLVQENLEGELRAYSTQYTRGCGNQGRDLSRKHCEARRIVFSRAAGPIKSILQQRRVAAVVLGRCD